MNAVRSVVLVALVAGCSGSTEPGSRTVSSGSGGSGTSGAPATGSGGTSNSVAGSVATSGGGGPDLQPLGGSTSVAGSPSETCVTAQSTAVVERLPVDIIIAIDNSGSMQEEIDAVAENINVNFAKILETSGIDYRVILMSRHERQGRQTSICVTAPLSANATCPPMPDQPAFSERFFQYSLKVDSSNSLELLIATFDGSQQDEFDLAPQGWGAWLRPNATKVFLEITDDESDMPAAEFVAGITAKSPQFGTPEAPKFVFHSITGIGEKPLAAEAWLPIDPIHTSVCTGNQGDVENTGTVYQELSRATGGLRFPLCQFTSFDVVFNAIAQDVASKAALACEFAIPPPPAGRELDLAKVAVSYDPGDGSAAQTFGQAKALAECVPNAFYADAAAGKILLCPETCSAAQAGKNPKVDVLFTCEETFVDPPK
jgi:hypothetical protein